VNGGFQAIEKVPRTSAVGRFRTGRFIASAG
jgi:hypothetical protein